MKLGIPPVILSDRWLFPAGLDWNRFAVLVPERNIADLRKIIEGHAARSCEMGIAARAAFETYFADHAYFNYLVNQCVSIMRTQLIPERIFWSARNVNTWLHRLSRKLRKANY